MANYIFVTGGVVSSLGKGLTSASIGMLLERCGYKVAMQKLDPYINVDPGTMSPYQHGEVYVTDDGTEADLDLGHYERFTRSLTGRHSNYTTGRIYLSVIRKERAGDYLGQTVQVVPHIINEIKDAIKSNAQGADFAIVEVGGTVGDIESLPFLEACRQMRYDAGRNRCYYIHLTLLPYLRASGELKTKPTQHSVGRLREIGIIPNMLVCRTEKPMPKGMKEKISMFCNIDPEAVIEEQDVEHSIYELPLVLKREGVVSLICQYYGADMSRFNAADWEGMIENIKSPSGEVNVALVGKYIELTDAYKSIYEALAHAAAANRVKLNMHRIDSAVFEDAAADPGKILHAMDGVLVAPGFGPRGIEGKIRAIRHVRENKIPFFGICLGMQCAVIEFARNVLGLAGANSTEFDAKSAHPVISLLEEQQHVTAMGASMRLGAFPATVKPGSLAHQAYQADRIEERHRHRYEFNNQYRERFEKAGMICSMVNPDKELIEGVELKDHPWFLGVQAHPEYKSKPTQPGPLFREFIAAAVKRRRQR